MIKPRVLAECHLCQRYQRQGALVCNLYPVGFPGEICPDYAPQILTQDTLSWNSLNPPHHKSEDSEGDEG